MEIWYDDFVKTTVELPDPLLREAKQYAASQGIPLRQVMELALQGLLHSPGHRGRFRLRTATTDGEGTTLHSDWGEIRSLIYEGHGG